MTVYVDWDNHKIFGEEEFNDFIAEKAEQMTHDGEAFDEWLNYTYTASEIWNNSYDDEWRASVDVDWRTYCYDEIETEYSQIFSEYTVK